MAGWRLVMSDPKGLDLVNAINLLEAMVDRHDADGSYWQEEGGDEKWTGAMCLDVVKKALAQESPGFTHSMEIPAGGEWAKRIRRLRQPPKVMGDATTWTYTAPSVPGWYWLWRKGGPCVIVLVVREFGEYLAWEAGRVDRSEVGSIGPAVWSGPINVPAYVEPTPNP